MPHEGEKQAFLAAITASPLDCDLRRIFSDWLTEHEPGETVEIARQRRWEDVMTASRAWIAELAEELGGPEWYDERSGVPLTCETLIAAATNYAETGQFKGMGTNMGYEDVFCGQREEDFWEHFAIVTGIDVEADRRGNFFTCSC